jgi:hypothetical protein
VDDRRAHHRPLVEHLVDLLPLVLALVGVALILYVWS